MLFQSEQFDDEIEEMRELFYDIIKDFPTGITSTFLEKQFVQRYIQRGLARSLPKNWLNLLRHAEEFQIRDVSTFTILYLADAKIPEQLWTDSSKISSENHVQTDDDELLADSNGNNLNGRPSISTKPEDDQQKNTNSSEKEEKCMVDEKIVMPISQFSVDQFESLALSSLPSKDGPAEIHILSSLDPDNIFFRLKIWDPYCEYLNGALSHLPRKLSNVVEMKIGQILGAKIDGNWERVGLMRRSTANPKFWIVNAVDHGYFGAVHEDGLRPLTESVTAFKKIFLAICKLDGVKSRCQPPPSSDSIESNEIRWPPETQHYINEALQSTILKDKRIEFCPTSEWEFHADKKIPICTGRLLIDRVDFGEQLVSMGLAQRK